MGPEGDPAPQSNQDLTADPAPPSSTSIAMAFVGSSGLPVLHESMQRQNTADVPPYQLMASEMTSWPGMHDSDDSDGDGEDVPKSAFYSATPRSEPHATATKNALGRDMSHLRVDVPSAPASRAADPALPPSSPNKNIRMLDLPPPQLKRILSGNLGTLAATNLDEPVHVAVDDLPITEELARAAAEIDKCLQRRNKYMADETAAKAASLAPGARPAPCAQPPFLPFEPSTYSREGGLAKAPFPPRSAHELVFENGVYAVKTPDGCTLEAPVSCSEFYDDIRRTMKVVLNPPTGSFCDKRLKLIETKFRTYLLLNEDKEKYVSQVSHASLRRKDGGR